MSESTDLIRVNPAKPPIDDETFNLATGGYTVDADWPPLINPPRLQFEPADLGDAKTWLIIVACTLFALLIAGVAIMLPAGLHARVPTIKLY
jgi:hypothetical protein